MSVVLVLRPKLLRDAINLWRCFSAFSDDDNLELTVVPAVVIPMVIIPLLIAAIVVGSVYGVGLMH